MSRVGRWSHGSPARAFASAASPGERPRRAYGHTGEPRQSRPSTSSDTRHAREPGVHLTATDVAHTQPLLGRGGVIAVTNTSPIILVSTRLRPRRLEPLLHPMEPGLHWTLAADKLTPPINDLATPAPWHVRCSSRQAWRKSDGPEVEPREGHPRWRRMSKTKRQTEPNQGTERKRTQWQTGRVVS